MNRAAAFLLSCLLGSPTLAQPGPPSSDQAKDPAPDLQLEEIFVLGSYIPRADYQSISPVFTLGREELAIDSRHNLQDLLARYPQFRAGENGNTVDLVSRMPGRSSLNLRGLGPQRTLTLINGHRLGPSGTDGQVDINVLPVGLIEQVEVLTGGASTAYGSDAVAGVVNLKTRGQIEGLELDTNFGRTDRGDADELELSLLAGRSFASGRGQVTGFLGYFDVEAVRRSERDISANPLGENRNTGTLFQSGSVFAPSGLLWSPAVLNGQAVDGLNFDSQGNPVAFTFPADLYSTAFKADLQYAQERKTGGVFVNYELTPSLRANATLIYTERESKLDIDATVFRPPLLVNLDNPLLTPETRQVLSTNYDSLDTGFIFVPYYYRALQLGLRTRVAEQKNTWLNLELEGEWASGWFWNTAYTFSEGDYLPTEAGGASESRLQQAVLVNPATGECFDTSGGCSPANIFGENRLSTQAVAFLSEAPFKTREDIRQHVVTLRTNGQFKLAGRESGVALGLEWRRDEGAFKPSSRLQEASSFAGFFSNLASQGQDDVTEIYGELLIPLLEQRRWVESLELELGLRYSDYSKIGGEWTWKSGLNWQVNKAVRFRGMYQRAARAPNLEETYLAFQEFDYGVFGVELFDACAASNRPQDFPGFVDLCLQQGVAPELLADYEPAAFASRVGSNGGNENLDVEVADTYTLGLVWTPEKIEGLSLTLDYYRIDLEDFIFYLRDDETLGLCFLTGIRGGFCDGIERAPQGDVTRTRSSYYNLGSVDINGYDLSVNYALHHQAPWGWPSVLELSMVASKLNGYDVELGPGITYDCAGSFGSLCVGVVPKYRSNARVEYRSGPLAATLSWQWIDSVESDNRLRHSSEQYTEAIPHVGSESYLDLNLLWQASDSVSLSFTVINLTDNSPPLMGGNAYSINTDPRKYDAIGRRYQARLSVSF